MAAPCHSKGNGARGAASRKWAQTEGTNSSLSERGSDAAAEAVGTVPAMTETTPPPGHVTAGPILSLEDLQDRYGIGKTKATELALSAGFPNSVVAGMHRYPLAALEAWELAHALAGTVAQPAPPAAPVIVTPPSPARPGRKPAASREAA